MKSDRKLMQQALEALDQQDYGQNTEIVTALRERLARPELDGRKLQRMRQEHWRKTDVQWKDDPELCFALGYEAGYNDAVAPKAEPRASESGAGFESLPASPDKQPEQEPVAWADPKDLSRKGHDLWVSTERVDHYTAPLYTAPQPQPEQEPVAEMLAFDEYGPQLIWHRHWLNYSVGTKLYTAPQPRQWVSLTNDDIAECGPYVLDEYHFARAIEAKLREKNT